MQPSSTRRHPPSSHTRSSRGRICALAEASERIAARMMRRSQSPAPALGLALALAVATAAPASAQAQRTFTPEDALQVRMISVADATSDLSWLATTVTTAGSRTATDHFRFGDATYLAPVDGEFQLRDRSGEVRWEPFRSGPVHILSAQWSPDGTRLAVLRHDLEAAATRDPAPPADRALAPPVRLEILDPSSRSVTAVTPSTDHPISTGSALRWLPDGSGLIMGLRTPDWAERARSGFLELTDARVVVHDASEDFLAWHAVRNLGGLERLAIVRLEGDVHFLTSEGNFGNLDVADDGAGLTFTETRPLRTSYERGQGTEYTVLRITPIAGGGEASPDALPTPDTLLAPTEDRIQPNFSPDGRWMAWSRGGNIFLRTLDADSARNVTEPYRIKLPQPDSARRSYSLERWHSDSGTLLLRAQDGFYLLDAEAAWDAAPAEAAEEEPPEGDAPEPDFDAPSAPDRIWAFSDDPDEREKAPRLNVVDWTEDGRWLYVSHSARDRWERGLIRFDVRDRSQERLVADSDLYRDWRVSDDGSRIVFRRSDGDRPDELWVARGDLSEARALTALNPQLDAMALSRSELIRYLDVDGKELYGILHYPVDYEPGTAYPLVAEIYESYFDNGWNYSAQNLAARGWFVLRPSVNLEEGYPGEGWMKGVTTAINGLIDRGMVDGDRLGVHGTSYGGYAANILIGQTDRFAAAINISGKVNAVSFLGDSEKITTRNYTAAEWGQDRIGATLWEQPHKYIAHSAVFFADRIETPLLLLTGEGDWNVPAANTREMYYALRRLGREVVWVNYMQAGHGAGRAGSEADFLDHWDRIFSWYERHFDPADEAMADDDAEADNGQGESSGQGPSNDPNPSPKK
ncbi:MAG: S9 family peptidase [Gemmatimonadales bacterium]|nr:MAG: S9 family peptidase [Gemmatimonadales bacterium]